MRVCRLWSKMKMIISKKINNRLLLQMGGRTVPVLQNTLISKMVKIGDLGGVRSNPPDCRIALAYSNQILYNCRSSRTEMIITSPRQID